MDALLVDNLREASVKCQSDTLLVRLMLLRLKNSRDSYSGLAEVKFSSIIGHWKYL